MAEVPARIGPYEVVGRLGVGGMAETYVALRRGPGGFEQRVCLKVVRPDHADDPERVRQFLAEAALVARLRHAAITQVLDFGQEGEGYYLALELVDGLDLSQLLRAGALPAELVLYVAVELATALDFAHRAGGDATLGPIVHRDVSPSNALISVEGEVKLSDFGIARPLQGPQHTATGIVKGKVPYLAPEYARSGRFDARCDLFSLGAVLYECASGVAPHSGATDIETIERAGRGERAPLSKKAPELPEALVAVIEQLLEPDPERRMQSAGALLEALASMQVSQRARRELGRRVVEARAAQIGSAATELRRSSPPEATLPLAPRLDLESVDAVVRRALGRGPKLALVAAGLSLAALIAVASTRNGATAPAAVGAMQPGVVGAPAAKPIAPLAAPASPEAPIAAGVPIGAGAPAAAGAPAILRPLGDATLASADAKPSRPATLEVIALPYGEVSIDGVVAGSSPITLRLAPGAHAVSARSKDGKIERRVTLKAGERKQLVLR